MEKFTWLFAQVKTNPPSVQTSPEDGCGSLTFLIIFRIELRGGIL